MNKVRTLIQSLALLAVVVGISSIAHAQTRTWVSGVGDDLNPCSRTAPCKTFAGAISKTADKGEIDCLDPGGFGTVTITKNITIDGTTGAGFGSILAAGTNGVNVNDSATATPNTIIVTLRNLSINGASTGFDGVRFTSGKTLFIENCQIFGFRGNGTNSDALEILVNSGAVTFAVHVKDSRFENNTGDGIRQGVTAGTLNASYDGLRLAGNAKGLEATGGTANISNSVVDNNTTSGLSATGGAVINANNNVVTTNGTGISSATGSTVRISLNAVHRNTTGLSNSATMQTCSNNKVYGNTTDVSGAVVAVPAPGSCTQ
jgi:hypothetical protein